MEEENSPKTIMLLTLTALSFCTHPDRHPDSPHKLFQIADTSNSMTKSNPKCDADKNTIAFQILKYFFQTELIHLEPCHFAYIHASIQTAHTRFYR